MSRDPQLARAALENERAALRRAAPDPAPESRSLARAFVSEARFILGFALITTAVIVIAALAWMLWAR